MTAVDLSKAKAILEHVDRTIALLHGVELDDSDGQDNPKCREDREERRRKATLMRELLLAADRLAAVEAIVRNEYWVARGNPDIFAIERGTP